MLMFQFLSLKVEVKYSVKLGGDAPLFPHDDGQRNSSIQSLSDPSKTAVRGNTVPKSIVSVAVCHCAGLYLADSRSMVYLTICAIDIVYLLEH